MSEDEFVKALPRVLEAGEPVAVMRDGERLGTFVPVPEPRANGAAINEIIDRYGVPLPEGEPDPLLESLEAIRSISPDLDGDPWRD